MKSCTCVLLLLFGLGSFVKAAPEPPAAVTESTIEDEQKLLLECQNSDYRTYIKCLKRQKRQHGRDFSSEMDPDCLHACVSKCHSSSRDCDRRCSHCYRKTKHRHQIITEYETTCEDDNCSEPASKEGIASTNITTKIELNNVINLNRTHLGGGGNITCCPYCLPPIPCLYPYPFPYNPHYPHYPNYPQPNFPLTLVPQLTLGLGLGVGGNLGCQLGNGWPCIPNYLNTGNIDCSGCWNPMMGLKCDIYCYSGAASNTNPSNKPCQSPHCVGGT